MSHLHKQHWAISPGYPSQEIMKHIAEMFNVTQMRFCSIDDPQIPQLTEKMSDPVKDWQGQVNIFFTLKSTRGKDESWWTFFVTSVGMQLSTQVERTNKYRGQLWRLYADLWPGSRAIELLKNVVVLAERKAASARPTAAPSDVPLLPIPLPGPDALSDMPPHDRDRHIQLVCAAEDESYYQGQPQKPGKHRTGFKSKRDQSTPQTLTAAAARKPTPAQAAIQAASLTVSEKVVHAAAHNMPSESWRSILLAWLLRSNVYSKTSSKDHRPIGMLRRLLPDVSNGGSFFNVKNPRGIAMHLPARIRDDADGAAHTLELHRAALALEHRTADVLRTVLALYHEKGKANVEQLPGVNAAFVADLHAAMSAMGGISGEGPQYWSAVQDPRDLLPNAGILRPLIHELAETRAGAFNRQYAVFDEWTWVLPIFAAIFAVRAEHEARETSQSAVGVRALAPQDYKYAIDRQNNARRSAIEVDHAPLIHYGRKLAQYFERISEIASVLGMDGASTSVTEFAQAKLSQYERDKTLVPNRVQTERNEIANMIRGLCPSNGYVAVERVRTFNAVVAERMRQDSYRAQNTVWLMPTPSMPWATNDPGRYLQGGAGPSAAAHVHTEPSEAKCAQPDPSQPGEI